MITSPIGKSMPIPILSLYTNKEATRVTAITATRGISLSNRYLLSVREIGGNRTGIYIVIPT